jgi:hypothetical protein
METVEIKEVDRDGNEIAKFSLVFDDDTDYQIFNSSNLGGLVKTHSVQEALKELIQPELEEYAKASFKGVAEVSVEIVTIEVGSLEVLIRLVELATVLAKAYAEREDIRKCIQAFADSVRTHGVTLAQKVGAYLTAKLDEINSLLTNSGPAPPHKS